MTPRPARATLRGMRGLPLVLVLALVSVDSWATVTGTTSTSGPYVCNGTTTVYYGTFKISATTDLVVTKQPTGGSTVTLAAGTDYTATIGGPGSVVTLTAGSKCPSGYTLTISRLVPLTQTTSFTTQGTFSPRAHESAFDKATIQVQQVDALVDTTIATHAADKATQALRDAAQDVATLTQIGTMAATLRSEMSPAGEVLDARTVLSTGSVTARTLANRFSQVKYAKDYGAVGNGTTDDTGAFLTAIAAMTDGDTLDAEGPTGTRWRLTGTITINKNIRIRTGQTYFLIDHDGVAFEFNPAGRADAKGAFGRTSLYDGVTPYGLDLDLAVVKKENFWASGSVGIRIWNSFHGYFNIRNLRGFQYGLILMGAEIDGKVVGSSYNVFHFGWFDACRYGLTLTTSGAGWNGENSFYGGSWSGPSQAGASPGGVDGYGVYPDAYAIRLRETGGNHFYNPSLENAAAYGIKMQSGATMNTVFYPRFEMTDGVSNLATYYLDFEDVTVARNTIFHYATPAVLLTLVSDIYGNYNRILTDYWEYSSRTIRVNARPGDDWALYLGANFAAAVASGYSILPLHNDSPGVYDMGEVSGAVVVDLNNGRWQRMVATGTITAFTRTHTPSFPGGTTGAELVIEILQKPSITGGVTISDLPIIIDGTNCALPVKRTAGRDVYFARYAGAYGGTSSAGWACIGQHSQG